MIFVGTDTDTAQAASTSELTSVAYKYLGVPYVYGGSTARGLDCSGFTSIVFNSLGHDLNRTTTAQYKQGSSVSKASLKSGDLVFFNTTGSVSHVGIYLGNNKFIHAGTSTGVTVAKLNSSYWAKRYVGAKRVASFDAGTVASTGEVKNAAIDFSVYASRGEVAIQLAEALGLDTSDTESSFVDVKSTAKYAGAVEALRKMGVFTGDENGKFNPASPLTRAELAKVLVTAFKLEQKGDNVTFTDVPSAHYAASAISILASNEITLGKGNGTFGLKDHVKLTDLAAFIQRIQK